MNQIKVLVADDQPVFCEGLAALLKLELDIKVVACAVNGSDAIKLAEMHRPDIVLMDLRMPEVGGLSATRIIKAKFPDIKIVMLTTFFDDEYIAESVKIGASGYLLKDADTDQIIRGIRDCYAGQLLLPASFQAMLADHLVTSYESVPLSVLPDIAGDTLTRTEEEMLHLLLAGKKNKEIAEDLYLSVGTVKNYLSQLYKKLNVRSRREAMALLKNR
ncbi:response regulator transcription factor [Sediminibacillus halophilus]|uniref:DNA-binding response regulator, NarL/FixJ family, contains REC and HTH domains n=1 Tax=Sediminibacillus halophilus TaxID=482461 RepID=A0A1G9VGF7_9BACI|nr:response regulator transcription factor [Sediminibacillus halophilus]SDM71190.1 DNA-binding response regulator, NarL/FixJ family, contains REC and HTH domains [Sediminibacillus halophilus]